MGGAIPALKGSAGSGKTVFRPKNARNDRRVCDMNARQGLDPVQQAQREYLESRILAAQPAELIEILYQIAIQSLKKAIGYLKSGEALERAGEVSRAQEAV